MSPLARQDHAAQNEASHSGSSRQYRAAQAHHFDGSEPGDDLRGIQFFRGLCLALLVFSLCAGAAIMLALAFASPH